MCQHKQLRHLTVVFYWSLIDIQLLNYNDRVLVMAGMIVADGTHAQLVATANTAYEQFVNAGKE